MRIGRRAAIGGLAATLVAARGFGGSRTVQRDPGQVDIAERVAQARQARMHIPDLPREAVLGYPVPRGGAGQEMLAFPLFLRLGPPGGAPQLTAPGWLLQLDLATGTQPTGQKLDADLSHAIGPHRINPPLDMDGFRRAEAELYHLMGRLVPFAAAGTLPAGRQADAQAFARLWTQLAHRPIQPYYHQLNPRWFAMVGLG